MRYILRLLFFSYLLSVTILADSMLEKTGAPISINKPNLTIVSQVAILSGRTLPKLGKVKIEVEYPAQNNNSSAKNWTLYANVDNKGFFKIDFKNTQNAGKYNITAFAPDKKSSAKTVLNVMLSANYRKQVVKQFIENEKRLSNLQSKKVNSLETKLTQIPQSPATQKVKVKLKEITKSFSKDKEITEKIKKSYDKINRFIDKYPQTDSTFMPLFKSLEDSSQKMENEYDNLEDEFNSISYAKPTKCDDLDAIVSGLKFTAGSVQLLINLLSLPASIMEKGITKALASNAYNQGLELTNKKLLSDNKMLPGAKKPLPDDAIQYGKSVLNYAIDAHHDSVNIKKNSLSIINSSIDFFAGDILSKYCEKYSGKFEALFVAQFYAYKDKWWSYSLRLNGMLNLRYEKSNNAKNIRVSGEFEGNAGDFLVWDDLLVATPYMKRYVAFHLTLPPLDSIVSGKQAAQNALANEFGKMGRYGFGAYAFLIPVHGVINGNKMMLEVGKAVKDYSNKVKGIAWYIMVEPSMPIPYVMTADLPMVKAHFIIDRAMRGKATFDIKTDNKVSSINKKFTRTEKADNGEYKVNWALHIKACNPFCLKE